MVLLCLISAQQTAYVQNRNINESTRLISDITEIANNLQMESSLVTIDVENLLTHSTINIQFQFRKKKKQIWSKLYLLDRNNFEKSRFMCH